MEQFFAIIFGALISALVSILSVYLAGKMREQEWKKENIYKPLYNEVNSLLATNWFGLPQSFSTKWTAIDSYSRLLIDKKLRIMLDSYKRKIEEYNLISAKCEEALGKYLSDLEEAVKRALAQFLTEDKKSILLENQMATPR
jgi:hypothetical protein